MPQCSDTSIDDNFRCCSVICTSSAIFQNSDQYNTGDTDPSIQSIGHGGYIMDRIDTDVVQYENHFVKPLKTKEYHERILSCSLAQKKGVAWIFNHTSLAGNFRHICRPGSSKMQLYPIFNPQYKSDYTNFCQSFWTYIFKVWFLGI